MTIRYYEGPAGVGKTYRLLEDVGEFVSGGGLAEHQRVLALTFMNGSRRRLSEKLQKSESLRRRSDCMTIDALAKMLAVRWRSLVRTHEFDRLISPDADEFTGTCQISSHLLGQTTVRKWIAIRYPVIILDEAQDLSEYRLAIVQRLSDECRLYAAADEFQCLDTRLVPSKSVEWLGNACVPIVLDQNRRTSEVALLRTANAIRGGEDALADFDRNENNFKIEYSQSGVKIIAANGTNANPSAFSWNIANAIRQAAGRLVILTPDARGPFILNAVSRVTDQEFNLNRQAGTVFGPYNIQWEMNEDGEVAEICGLLDLQDQQDLPKLVTVLEKHLTRAPVKATLSWACRKASVIGQRTFSREEIHEQIAVACRNIRRFASRQHAKVTAMTIHQAKNREFRNVLVLWPRTVPGDAENQRRLLYNAVTRAREQCTILVHGKNRFDSQPFR